MDKMHTHQGIPTNTISQKSVFAKGLVSRVFELVLMSWEPGARACRAGTRLDRGEGRDICENDLIQLSFRVASPLWGNLQPGADRSLFDTFEPVFSI